MQVRRRMPVLNTIQYMDGMEIGWCTKASTFSKYEYFPFAENEDAKEVAERKYGKKNAVPYWEFEGRKVVNPVHNKYYLIDEKDVLREYTKIELLNKFEVVE